MNTAALAELHGALVDICCATAFLVAGLTACAIAAMRRSGVRVFLWLGIWSSAYGVLHLFGTRLFVEAMPRPLQIATPYIETCIAYTIVVFAAMAWRDLIIGKMRRFVIAMIVAALVVAVLGIGTFLMTGRGDKFMPLNNLVAASILLFLITVVSSKTLFQRYLLLPHRSLLAVGTFVFAAEALFVNMARPFGIRSPLLLDHLGFAALLIAFGYSAMHMVLVNERRLLAIENELEVARQIQNAILPTEVPELLGLKVAASYQPMDAVAGDFYEFLPVDRSHAGFLIADVCGHGMPAALIASMLKVAVQSVAENAEDPAKLLGALNHALSGPLRGKLVSAAYLWVDMEKRKALYSAAGHPPLLHSHDQRVEPIESNGLLFGVLPNADYPVSELVLHHGDRFLIYTDGITEAENVQGEAFGDSKLPSLLQVAGPPEETSQQIAAELRKWNSAQQDDATLILLEVL